MRHRADAFEGFCAQASAYLRDEGAAKLEGWLAKPATRGKWHPNGFAVFHLGPTPLGLLRFHVWPKALRRPVASHPRIHRHSWDLASRILVGRYTERMVEVRADPRGSVSMCEVVYRPEGERLEALEGRFSVTLGPRQSYLAKEFHYVAAGTFHETLIPRSSLVATLMISAREEPSRHALMHRGGLDLEPWSRPELCPDEQARVLGQVERAL